MTLNTETETLLAVLRTIAAGQPNAWYPREGAPSTGLPRDAVDEILNRLRLAGLVRMTDWESGRGQGYVLTVEGQRILQNPGRLSPQRLEPKVEPPTRESCWSSDATITRLLVAAQIGTFLFGMFNVMQLGRPVSHFLSRGAGPVTAELGTSAPAILHGEWWTLLTYALVHGGLAHLTLNVIGHLYDVAFAERMWGRLRLLTIYFASVLMGGVGAVWAAPRSLTVGSSGGWCGTVAALAVLVAARRDQLSAEARQAWFRSFLRVVVLVTTFSLLPGVSWGGHLGGALGGAFAATCLLATVHQNIGITIGAWFTAIAGPIAAASALYFWITRQVPWV